MESLNSTSNNRWTKNCQSEVKNVVIVGATHGNELHGLYLVNDINSEAGIEELKKFPTLSVNGVIGNIAATTAIGTGAGRRYCDVDMNRCFTLADLADPSITTIEGLRAKELDAMLGPKSSDDPKTDLILDFHSTTSNTGVLLCCHPQDTFALQLVAYLQGIHPLISVSLWPDSEVSLLPSIARSGLTVEVGPISHSTSNSALYQETKKILYEALFYTEMHNTWIRRRANPGRSDIGVALKTVQMNVYKKFATLGFPRHSDGAVAALIHPSLMLASELEGGTTISVGDPIFQIMSDGSDMLYTEGETDKRENLPEYRIDYAGSRICNELLYPQFINEAAYNEKDIAFILTLCRQVEVNILTRML